MKELSEGSVEAFVCDPPYGLKFMSKEFDDLGEGKAQRLWHKAWLEQAYRVLKPGGIIKAFGGTRTLHHLAAAMEDVGFQNISLEAWAYGSGFPKSLNISKAIDRAAGAEREVVGQGVHGSGSYSQKMSKEMGFRPYTNGLPSENNGGKHNITAPATEAAKQWEGWGTALKPAWEPVVVGYKP
jgi:site-specific DNA-methyltransferase (adenine-specific)